MFGKMLSQLTKLEKLYIDVTKAAYIPYARVCFGRNKQTSGVLDGTATSCFLLSMSYTYRFHTGLKVLQLCCDKNVHVCSNLIMLIRCG